MKKYIYVLKNNYNMIKLVAVNVPIYFFFYLFIFIINALIAPFNSVYFLKTIFDMLENDTGFNKLLSLIIIVVIVNIFVQILNSVFWNYIDAKYRQVFLKKIKIQIFNKVITINQKCFDEPEFYNNYVWAVSESDSRALQTVQNFFYLISSFIKLMYIVSILSNIDSILVIVIMISVLFGYYIGIKLLNLGYKRENELKPLGRKREYISRVFYLADYAKEIRTSKIKNILFEYYKKAHDEITEKYKQYNKLTLKLMLLMHLFIMVVFEIFTIFFLSYKALIMHSITLGGYTASFTGIWQLYSSVSSFMDSIKNLKENSIYIDKYDYFMNYKDIIKDKNNSTAINGFNKKIWIRNVYFKYKNSERYILRNINLEINKGDKIAIVGHNGAGKSTLIKLILRLYEPVLGEIILDGHNIKNLKLKDYRNLFGSVMQNFNIYSCKLSENICMDININNKNIMDAMYLSGFIDKYNYLPNKLDTILLREFDEEGILLSGGESQKLALTRAFYSDKDIIILDESLSELDPISEYDLNQKMKKLSKDKTAIYISHRLSVTTMVDKIYLMENGEIIEQGNHTELMDLNGKYAQMFNMQAENYREETASL